MSTDPKSTKFDVTNSKYELVGPSVPLSNLCQALEACSWGMGLEHYFSSSRHPGAMA